MVEILQLVDHPPTFNKHPWGIWGVEYDNQFLHKSDSLAIQWGSHQQKGKRKSLLQFYKYGYIRPWVIVEVCRVKKFIKNLSNDQMGEW